MPTPTGTATITAKYGPGKQATAKVHTGIQGVYLDLARSILALHMQNSDPTSPQLEYDLVGIITFTVTIANTNYTFTVAPA